MTRLPEYVVTAIGDLASAARIEQKAIMRLPSIWAVEPYIKDRRQAEIDLEAAIARYGAECREDPLP